MKAHDANKWVIAIIPDIKIIDSFLFYWTSLTVRFSFCHGTGFFKLPQEFYFSPYCCHGRNLVHMFVYRDISCENL